MDFEPTRLPEVVLIRPRAFKDDRGWFMETWQERKFAAAGIDARFVQDNHSHSVRHARRWDDPTVGVRWPLPPGIAPQLSPKDAVAPLLGDVETCA